MTFSKNKKGILDSIFMIAFGVILIFVVIAIWMAQINFNNSMEEFASSTDLTYVNETVEDVLQPTTQRTRYFIDFVLMMIIFGGGLVAVIINYIFPRNSIYLAINVVLTLSIGVAAFVIDEALKMFADNSFIQQYLDSLPFTSWVIENYVVVYAIFIVAILIANFMKPK